MPVRTTGAIQVGGDVLVLPIINDEKKWSDTRYSSAQRTSGWIEHGVWEKKKRKKDDSNIFSLTYLKNQVVLDWESEEQNWTKYKKNQVNQCLRCLDIQVECWIDRSRTEISIGCPWCREDN